MPALKSSRRTTLPSLVNKCGPAAGASRSAGTGSCKKSCRAGFSGAAALFCVERNEKEYDGCHIPLQFFQQYDREHQTQYIQTLMAYFSCGRNMTRTSNALFIHKTTLFYRFERMEKLVGPFLQQPKRLFLYEYSLHLLHEITPYPGV